ncbi:hypothetical protein [Bradyrhizobium sp.]|uniref:hypothetical protein n=1 Tax=Bradyrhizobium sp. TaxID=376 RepID=UPI002733179C|nr:hypothetical protein [Bradyrhizobium sp.]MDP3693754.1 hypothetical protein [Bradyrhizobium sp.]
MTTSSAVLSRIVRLASRRQLRFALVAALVLTLTAIITNAGIRASLQFGRLSIPPTYDDVVYFVSAAKWLSAATDRSLTASLLAILGDHAPFSMLTAAAGFLATPGSYVGHYAVNAVFVAGFLSGIAALVWRSRLVDIAICVTGTACFPLLVQAINEARPDLPWGLASGLAIGALIRKPVLERPLLAVAALGFSCGLAALIKPSALPVSLACFAVVFVLSTVSGRLTAANAPTIRGAALRFAIFGLCVAVTLGPYLSVSFGQIAGYIWRTLVENRALWALDASLYGHASYYSFGAAGHLALNGGLLLGLGLFAVRLAWGALSRSNDVGRALALLSAVAVTYAIPSVSTVKSYFLGAMFYGTFIVASALNFAAILALLRGADGSAARAWIPGAVRAVILVMLAGVFLRATLLKEASLATTFDESTRRQISTSTEAVWSVVRRLALDYGNQPGRQFVVAFSSPFPTNPASIELYAQQARISVVVRVEFFHRSLADVLSGLTRADVAVVASSIQHHLPVPRMGDDIVRALDERSDLCVIQAIPVSDSLVLRIYRKSDQGCSLPLAR